MEFIAYVDRIWRLIEDDVRKSVIEGMPDPVRDLFVPICYDLLLPTLAR